MSIFSKVINFFGSHERELAKYNPIVEEVNKFEEEFKKFSDEELKKKTEYFKQELKDGKKLEDILPEAFATVREAASRVIGERPYDVQILGGIVLHQGKISEMKTGEGKTLTSTLPVYLNALAGKGVHVVTVNDYLAKRDCNWMGAIYNFLGLSTSCILHETSYFYEPHKIDKDEVSVEMENLKPISKKEAYAADITYGTNNEFGFDYLRDNMVIDLEKKTQRDLAFAIVDEVDFILIDEARTPLIISAPDSESTKLYQRFAQIVPRLKEKDDYEVDEKMKTVVLTEKGINKVEAGLGVGDIYAPDKINYVHHLEQSLKAEVIFKRDKDYVVKDNQVIIVDDFTGRLMPGRRYSDGLHQALEAKERVEVQRESKTMASITFQNYFRMYKKLSGMTGTALTSAEEFSKVYELDVISIPTNKPTIREDERDVVYKTEKGKFEAIIEEIKELNKKGQPVLVGTIAIEKSEYLSALLERSGVSHQVLNAKQHEKEASIITNAGQKGSVTIATNMAGRGTDIKLSDEVKKLGGLYIIGTERHEARRIDNQLRGRSGRQGDPGFSRFFISLEDELMRRFGGDKMKNMMNTLRLPEDQPIENALISKIIESAQTKIEGFNFDIRKHVLEYDDVMNKQRETVYKKRNKVLALSKIKDELVSETMEEVERVISVHAHEEEEWVMEDIIAELNNMFNLEESQIKHLNGIYKDKNKSSAEKMTAMMEYLTDVIKRIYAKKEKEIGEESLRRVGKGIMLQSIDTLWMNHLDEIDYLREGIGLRGYGQRDPLVEYKKDAFNLFSSLMDNMRATMVRMIFRLSPSPQGNNNAPVGVQGGNLSSTFSRNLNVTSRGDSVPFRGLQFKGSSGDVGQFGRGGENSSLPQARAGGNSFEEPKTEKPIINKNKVGRNDPCPCGSGKKYKKCHGR